MLKFEGVAEVGQIIRAFDFEPREGMPNEFIEGRVVKKGEVIHPEGFYMFDGFHIEITGAARENDGRIGDVGYIPFEIGGFGEWDGRVERVGA